VSAVATATVAERLADHVLGVRFADIPSDVVDHVKDLVANHVGLAFTGRSKEGGAQAMALARELGSGDSTILGQTLRARPLDAIFATSALIASSQWHDYTHDGLHPGVVTHPTAWVLGEHGHRPGSELIAALAVGYDVGCTLSETVAGFQNYARRRGFVFGPLCSAGTAARMLGLEREQTAHALGIAAHSGLGLVEGTDTSWYLYPLTSRLGAFAAYLARGGADAAPQTIEGKNGFFMAFYGRVPDGLDATLAGLGHDLAIGHAVIKKFKSSGANVIPIERMLALVRSGIREPDVVEVVAHIPEQRRPRDTYMEQFIEGPDPTPVQAMQSLRFLLAVILVRGALDDAAFDDVHDPALQAAFRKVRLNYEPGHAYDFRARIEVTLRDGSRRVEESDQEERTPIDRGAALRRDGERFLSARRLDELTRAIDHLEDVRDVADVVRLTVPDR
jgi:2-methylcitrate dehydratase PrpD